MARVVFVIPVSTVASELYFSTSGHVLDVFCSSLSPKMVEALICTQNWLNLVVLKFYDKDFDQFDSIEKIIGGQDLQLVVLSPRMHLEMMCVVPGNKAENKFMCP
ncbi:unnamed protein product [Lupinus luteus]|uniref:HAT C-terminal dimerisation domain-containing protein n=1 Tax=Lupinus luteus TaxID=3873 RepID=A0AAV1W137_LUPLU